MTPSDTQPRPSTLAEMTDQLHSLARLGGRLETHAESFAGLVHTSGVPDRGDWLRLVGRLEEVAEQISDEVGVLASLMTDGRDWSPPAPEEAGSGF